MQFTMLPKRVQDPDIVGRAAIELAAAPNAAAQRARLSRSRWFAAAKSAESDAQVRVVLALAFGLSRRRGQRDARWLSAL